MSSPTSPAAGLDFDRVVHAARLELETAGNPSFIVVVVDASGTTHLSPLVYFTHDPAREDARRAALTGAADDVIVIVSRQAVGHRALFTVLDPATMKKLHTQLEVVETTFAQDHAPV
jgi:hypothetical protein